MVRFSLDGLTGFSTAPLRFASYLGMVVALSGIPYAGWAIDLRLFTDEAVHGWASLVVALLLVGGLQLLCLGIVGEYIGRMYEEVKGRPLYIADEVMGDVARARNLPAERGHVLAGGASARGVRVVPEPVPLFTEKISG